MRSVSEAESVIFMNSNHDIKTLDDKYLQHVAKCKEVICGLQPGLYAETAKEISRLSLTHKNIKGAVIDDFLDWHGPSAKMTPDELRTVYQNLKSENPALKLYVVRYTWQDQKDLLPYLEYFDAINLWVWVSTDHYWRAEYGPDLDHIKKITGKPVLQGLFIQNYGETWGTSNDAVSMEIVRLQTQKTLNLLRDGTLEGCVILQNGWFCRENHREQLQWLKEYTDWFYGTTTWR